MESNILKQFDFFNDFSDEIKNYIQFSSEIIEVAAGCYLMKEGEAASDMFLILAGEVAILQQAAAVNETIVKQYPGDVIGEFAYITKEPRMTSAKTVKNSQLLKIPYKTIDAIAKQDPAFYEKLTAKIIKKFNVNNKKTIALMAEKNKLLALKNQHAFMLLGIIITMTFIALTMRVVMHLSKMAVSSAFVSVLYLLVLASVTIFFYKKLGLPLAKTGLNLINWKRAVLEAVIYSMPIIVLIFVLKLALIYLVPAYQMIPLFDIYSTLNTKTNPVFYLFVSVFLYSLFIPLQEWVARGVLQNQFVEFFEGPHKVALAILASNLLFSSAHLYLSVQVAIIAFLLGLFWGWLYSKQESLMGVCVSHFLIGIWGFKILSFTRIYYTYPF